MSDKRMSELVEELRGLMVNARRFAVDLGIACPKIKQQIIAVEEMLTRGIVIGFECKNQLILDEILQDDKDRGTSVSFVPRGIGLDLCPGCFVCKATIRSEGANSYLNNIAAFVKSKVDGYRVMAMFENGARLDYRENEPNWIQVKVGACDKHLPNLEKLLVSTSRYGLIRQVDVVEARQGAPV